MVTLHYSIKIHAPKEKVWDMMIGKEGFKKWTSAFETGSYYDGTWEKGEEIKFLTPEGDGMASIVEELIPYEFSSVKTIHSIKDGKKQIPDESGFEYPAYENYTFIEQNGSTTVKVSTDMPEEFIEMMDDQYPEALEKLKSLCEQ